MYMKWQDEYAAWKQIGDFELYKDYKITLSPGELWTPVMILDNSALDLQYIEFSNRTDLRINPDGTVEAEMTVRFESACALDVQKSVPLS